MSNSSDFVIENGVLKKYTGVGGDVVIPGGVTNINFRAFLGCSGLTSVTIPDGVTSIGAQAFLGCSGLTSVTIPDSVTSIGNGVFSGCKSLTSITVSADNESYSSSDGVLFGKAKTVLIQHPAGNPRTTYTIPESVTSIGVRAFQDGTNLTGITIPDSVTSIGNGAFDGCSNLQNITIPNGVTSIDDSTFSDCKGLKTITLPDSVTSIGDRAFSHCEELTGIDIPQNVTNLGSVTHNDGRLAVGGSLFCACQNLKSVSLPDGINGISDSMIKWMFYECNNLQSIIAPHFPMADYSADYKKKLACGFAIAVAQGRTISDERRKEYMKYIKGQRKKLYSAALQEPALMNLMVSEKILQNEDVEGIIEASENDPTITAMLLDYRQKNLKPDDMEKKFEQEIKAVERQEERKDAFAATGVLSAGDAKKIWQYEKKEDGTILLKGYKGTETSVNVPAMIGKDTVTEIGEYAFSPEAERLSQAVKQIRTNISSVHVPETVKTISSSAFNGCKKLADTAGFIVVHGVLHKYYGKGKEVIIPDGVTEIGENAFEGCRGLKRVVIPQGATTIGSRAFLNCKGLESVTIPNSMISINEVAFADCISLKDVMIPDSVTSIGKYAFSGCTSLTSITVPDSVADIGYHAFHNCNSLADANGFVIVRNILFNYFGDSENVIIPEGVTEIDGQAFIRKKTVSVVLPIGLTSIGSGAFEECTKLEHITFPDGLKSIGGGAFEGCRRLQSITVPDSVATIEAGAFKECKSLRTIELPVGLKSICDDTFWHCENLTDVVIPESVVSIGRMAFEGCQKLTNLVMPNGVTEIGMRAFNDCSNLADPNGFIVVQNTLYSYQGTNSVAVVPDGVTTIGFGAFSSKYKVTDIVLPDSVKSIEEWAFSGDLENITIPGSVTNIDKGAFYFCFYSKLTIHAPTGSYAEQYAKENQIPFAAE